MSDSLTPGPYESAVSNRFTPRSRAWCRTARASCLSAGGPQMPGPVRRMVPKPRRYTVRSPPIVNVPLSVAGRWVVCCMLLFPPSFFFRIRTIIYRQLVPGIEQPVAHMTTHVPHADKSNTRFQFVVFSFHHHTSLIQNAR